MKALLGAREAMLRAKLLMYSLQSIFWLNVYTSKLDISGWTFSRMGTTPVKMPVSHMGACGSAPQL